MVDAEDDLEGLLNLNEEIDAATRTEFAPGVYKHAISRRFPTGAKRGFLPIIAEDYTYTMDSCSSPLCLVKNTTQKETGTKNNRETYFMETIEGGR